MFGYNQNGKAWRELYGMQGVCSTQNMQNTDEGALAITVPWKNAFVVPIYNYQAEFWRFHDINRPYIILKIGFLFINLIL